MVFYDNKSLVNWIIENGFNRVDRIVDDHFKGIGRVDSEFYLKIIINGNRVLRDSHEEFTFSSRIGTYNEDKRDNSIIYNGNVKYLFYKE